MKIKTSQLSEDLNSSKSIQLIDVRTPAEHGEIHIEGAHLMPLDRLDVDAVKQAVGDSGQCVLVCHSGKRADQAFQQLSAAGIGNLAILDGGMVAWDQAGLPVNRGQKVLSLERQTRIAIGLMVILGAALGAWVHPGLYGICAFVGVGLIIAGATDWCGMAMVVAKMPWNQRSGVKCCGNSCSV